MQLPDCEPNEKKKKRRRNSSALRIFIARERIAEPTEYFNEMYFLELEQWKN